MNNEGSTTVLPRSGQDTLNELQRERDRLQQEIVQLRAERDRLSKALLALMSEEMTLNEDEILAQIGREKPLREFLQEMRAPLVGD